MNPFAQSYVKLPAPVAAQSLKWYPGHGIWMAPGMWSSAQSRNQLFNVDIPAIVANGAPAPHIQIEVQWNDLETGPGVYNWDVIDNKAAIAIAAGCKVLIKITCRTYGGFSSSVPDYMTSAAGTDYSDVTGGSGESQNGEYTGAFTTNATTGAITAKQFQAKLWIAKVADKYRDMLIAVALKYDSDPNLIGVIINETTQLAGVNTGMTPGDPRADVTLVNNFFRKWLNAIIAAKPYFQKTPVTWMTNFPAAGILSIFDPIDFNPTVQSEMLKYGIGGHEQDFYRRAGIVGQTLNTSYDAFDSMVGITPRFCNMSNGGSLFSSNGDKQNPTPPSTASQLAQEARSRGVNIILWHVVSTVSGAGGATWRDRILPVLLANRTAERPVDTFPSFYLGNTGTPPESQPFPFGPRQFIPTDPSLATLFVGPVASGNGSGSSEANAMLYTTMLGLYNPGDVIFWKGGTYNLPSNSILFTRSGTAGAHVIHEAIAGQTVIINGSARPNNDFARVEIRGEYLEIRRFEITGHPWTALRIVGSNNIIDSLHAHDGRHSGITIIRDNGGSANNNHITNCRFINNSDAGLSGSPYNNGGNADGISINTGDGNLIDYCIMDGNSDDGVDMFKGTNNELRYCIAMRNGKGTLGEGNGFKGGQDGITNNNLIERCLSYSNQKAMTSNGGINVTFKNMTSWNNVLTDRFYQPSTVVQDCIATNPNKWGFTGIETNNSWQRGGAVSFISTDEKSSDFLKPSKSGGFEDIGAWANLT